MPTPERDRYLNNESVKQGILNAVHLTGADNPEIADIKDGVLASVRIKGDVKSDSPAVNLNIEYINELDFLAVYSVYMHLRDLTYPVPLSDEAKKFFQKKSAKDVNRLFNSQGVAQVEDYFSLDPFFSGELAHYLGSQRIDTRIFDGISWSPLVFLKFAELPPWHERKKPEFVIGWTGKGKDLRNLLARVPDNWWPKDAAYSQQQIRWQTFLGWYIEGIARSIQRISPLMEKFEENFKNQRQYEIVRKIRDFKGMEDSDALILEDKLEWTYWWQKNIKRLPVKEWYTIPNESPRWFADWINGSQILRRDLKATVRRSDDHEYRAGLTVKKTDELGELEDFRLHADIFFDPDEQSVTISLPIFVSADVFDHLVEEEGLQPTIHGLNVLWAQAGAMMSKSDLEKEYLPFFIPDEPQYGRTEIYISHEEFTKAEGQTSPAPIALESNFIFNGSWPLGALLTDRKRRLSRGQIVDRGLQAAIRSYPAADYLFRTLFTGISEKGI